MPDFNGWLGSADTLNTEATRETRAASAWRRIQDRPTSLAFKRGTTTLSAQTVRVEESNGGSDAPLPIGTVGKQGVVVYGVQNHPTIADTDMLRGDRFAWDGKTYQITTVVKRYGEIQGFGEVTS